MRNTIGKVIGGAGVVVAGVAGVFVVGMRTQWPPVLRTVRRISRAMKPLVLKTAGGEGAYASVVRHLGRRTGRPYETPVVAVGIDDGFVIAMPYGRDTDWVKNVLAAGGATLVTQGQTYAVTAPEVIRLKAAESYFGAREQRQHRRFGVEYCLRVKRLDAPAEGEVTFESL